MTILEHESLVKKLIAEYGDDHRAMIMDALHWLEVSEPNWNGVTLNREEFLRELLSKAKRDSHKMTEIQEKADAME
jgi:hypothetical protein